MEEKLKELNEIVNKAKYYPIDKAQSSFSVTKSFGVEPIQLENNIENSMLFESLEEATELIWKIVPNNPREVVWEHIEKLLDEKMLDKNNKFRLLFHLS